MEVKVPALTSSALIGRLDWVSVTALQFSPLLLLPQKMKGAYFLLAPQAVVAPSPERKLQFLSGTWKCWAGQGRLALSLGSGASSQLLAFLLANMPFLFGG